MNSRDDVADQRGFSDEDLPTMRSLYGAFENAPVNIAGVDCPPADPLQPGGVSRCTLSDYVLPYFIASMLFCVLTFVLVLIGYQLMPERWWPVNSYRVRVVTPTGQVYRDEIAIVHGNLVARHDSCSSRIMQTFGLKDPQLWKSYPQGWLVEVALGTPSK